MPGEKPPYQYKSLRKCEKCREFKADVKYAYDMKANLCNDCWAPTAPRPPWTPRARTD